MTARRVRFGLLGVAAVPLTVVSLAWACAPQGGMALNPTSGVSGAVVSVSAIGFPEGAPVVIRWNDPGGPILASGTGPGFTATFTVPAATPARTRSSERPTTSMPRIPSRVRHSRSRPLPSRLRRRHRHRR